MCHKQPPMKSILLFALHPNPWPSVDRKLKECNIQNYSIYFRDGYPFSYLEYTGANLEEVYHLD